MYGLINTNTNNPYFLVLPCCFILIIPAVDFMVASRWIFRFSITINHRFKSKRQSIGIANRVFCTVAILTILYCICIVSHKNIGSRVPTSRMSRQPDWKDGVALLVSPLNEDSLTVRASTTDSSKTRFSHI